MNKANAKRLISKQEAVVLLAGLELVSCSETIESVSISNSKVIRDSSGAGTTKTFVERYAKRPSEFEDASMLDYFRIIKKKYYDHQKTIIPHFVGISGRPCYPVSDDYAKHVLVVYRPWRTYPTRCDWQLEFDNFIRSPQCPKSAQMTYQRVLRRYIDGTTHLEQSSGRVDHSGNDISPEDQELLDITGMKSKTTETDYDTAILQSLDRGVDFKWDAAPMVSIVVGLFLVSPRIWTHVAFLVVP